MGQPFQLRPTRSLPQGQGIASKAESGGAPIIGRGGEGYLRACSCEEGDQTMVTPLDEMSTSELKTPMLFEGRSRNSPIRILRYLVEQECAIILLFESAEDICTPPCRTDYHIIRHRKHLIAGRSV
jgi:hypothetical protein